MKIGVGDVVKIVTGEYEGMVGTVTHIGTGGGCEVFCTTNTANGDRYIDVWDFNLEPLIQDKNEVNEVKTKFKVGDLVIAFNRHDRKYVVVSAEWTQGCREYIYSCNWFDADGAHTEEFSEHVLKLYKTDEEKTVKNTDGQKSPYRRNIEDLLRRQEEKGLKKYGVTLDQNVTLTEKQRIEHIEEELIDGLMYCEHLKEAVEDPGWTANDYQRAALRTAQFDKFSDEDILLNGVMGLNGEAGEVIDLVKKARFQGHELDKEKLMKELGDVAWYLAVASRASGFDLSEVFEENIRKLKERYPDGFDKARSINRKENKTEVEISNLFDDD